MVINRPLNRTRRRKAACRNNITAVSVSCTLAFRSMGKFNEIMFAAGNNNNNGYNKHNFLSEASLNKGTLLAVATHPLPTGGVLKRGRNGTGLRVFLSERRGMNGFFGDSTYCVKALAAVSSRALRVDLYVHSWRVDKVCSFSGDSQQHEEICSADDGTWMFGWQFKKTSPLWVNGCKKYSAQRG